MNIRTDNTETLTNALQRNQELEGKLLELEAVVKVQKLQIETLEEALAGAHRIIQQVRDKDSILPPLDNSAPTP